MIERLLAAEAAFDHGEIDIAERSFRLVADADSRNAIAVVGLARIARQRGDVSGARTLAERALEIDPHEAVARRLLAELDRPPEPEPPEPGTASVPAAAPEVLPMTSTTSTTSTTQPPTPRSWWRRLLDRLRGRS